MSRITIELKTQTKDVAVRTGIKRNRNFERRCVVDSKGHGNQMIGYKVELEGCSEDDTEIFFCFEKKICLKPLLPVIAQK